MSDKPILFSAPMVRALLAGKKTQTRRVVRSRGSEVSMADAIRIKVGDLLWVREAFRGSKGYDNHPPRTWSHWPVHYEADGAPNPQDEMEENGRLRPGIHMPRWASRLTLSVTGVRVERLHDISETDARAEGCPVTWDGKPYDPPPPEVDSWQGYGRYSYCLLWSKINGAGSWDANPWVVAYTFTVQRGNIDQIERVAA